MKKLLKKTTAFATTLMLLPSVAFATSNSEWVKPATEKIDSFRDGLMELAIPVIGVCVIIAGLLMAVSERPNWKRVGTIVCAGILITAGPAIIMAFLG
ncbi:MAG: TrbC/VirB2 family protein [Alphaproteobacteria bacterium]|nr:TrbC/VirB2 family protein [Alphaproteobacteria bacterium]